MKRILLMLAAGIMLLTGKSLAQNRLPGFVIADVKGQYQKINAPVFSKPVLLIYFIPDCDDCRAFTDRLTKNDGLFAKYQVIMVTNADLNALKKFVTDFHLAGKKDLLIGTEGWTATLFRALQVKHFPFVALYSTKRLLTHNFTNASDLFKQ